MWEYFIYTYGSQVLLAILCMLFGGLGLLVRQLAQRYLTDECKRAAAATAVRFAEQVFSDLHGEEKLSKAMEAAALLLKNKRGATGLPYRPAAGLAASRPSWRARCRRR